jgi:methylase of polypeptide subunit release factors
MSVRPSSSTPPPPGVEPRVVELGIGSGALAARCLGRRPTLRLLGIDGDTSMMEMARQRIAVRWVVLPSKGVRRASI